MKMVLVGIVFIFTTATFCPSPEVSLQKLAAHALLQQAPEAPKPWLIRLCLYRPKSDGYKRYVCSQIQIKSDYIDGKIIMEVSDTGAGISEENIQKIFDPFFTTKEVGKGTGLGLSISYGIIKDQGGNITVKSIAGEGTTFTVEIPAPL